mgnify:CR=1 FL=1
MATKSFTKELTFNTKTAQKFLNALDDSKQVNIKSKHQVKMVDDKGSIKSIFSKLVRK